MQYIDTEEIAKYGHQTPPKAPVEGSSGLSKARILIQTIYDASHALTSLLEALNADTALGAQVAPQVPKDTLEPPQTVYGGIGPGYPAKKPSPGPMLTEVDIIKIQVDAFKEGKNIGYAEGLAYATKLFPGSR